MALIQLNNVSVSFSGVSILNDISFGLHPDQRVGLIGVNGCGKTTLLRILAGALEPEIGTAVRAKDIRIGFMEQEPNLPADGNLHDAALTAFDDVLATERRMRKLEHEIASADSEQRADLLGKLGRLQETFERSGGYERERRTAAVLTGLGFSREDLHRPVSVLSGGERSRVALTRLLLREPDILLLDEPTNHLDLAGIEWLENFLGKKYRGSVVLVSHDRTFLDRTVTKIAELSRGCLAEYSGDYTKYLKVKAHRQHDRQRRYDSQREFIRKEEDFIRRYGASQRVKEAKGRQKRLDRIERLDAPVKDRKIAMRFDAARESGEVCLRVEDLVKGFGDKVLFQGVGFEVYRGERLGIVGPNGCGKTTLLRILLEEETPDSGTVKRGHHLHIGYLSQQAERLTSERTVLDEVWERRRTLNEVDVRGVLGRFLFSGDDAVGKRLCDLSGGERTRVALACLMVEQPNLLIMDEPTNHLDIVSREALESALNDYAGTIVVVSHDRFFLNRIVEKLLVFEDGAGLLVHGDYSDYERRRKAITDQEPAPAPAETPKVAKEKPKLSKNRLAKLENDIAELEGEKEQLEADLADPASYSDAEKVRTASARYDEVNRLLETLYAEWASQDG